MKKILLPTAIVSVFLSGCYGTPARQVAESEVMEQINLLKSKSALIKAEKQEYDKNKKVLWIQPANKKEACKIFVELAPNSELPANYKVYWDGGCKDGYAYGLGREFEKADMKDNEALGEYSGGQVEPKYYMQAYKLEKIVAIGNVNEGKVSRKKFHKFDDGSSIETNLINDDVNGTGLFYIITLYTSHLGASVKSKHHPNLPKK